MLRRFVLVVDILLVAAIGFLAVHLYRAWTAPSGAAPAAPTTAAVTEPAARGPAPTPARPPFTSYAVVAERNLFNPNRTEAVPEPPKPTTTATGPPTQPTPNPRLYGVVILPDGKARAYLEDVQARRVFAYSVGDTIAESRVQEIRADRVIMRRGNEVIEILLRDPSKPKPAETTPAAGRAPGQPAQPGRPGVTPPTPAAPQPAPGAAATPPRLPRSPAVTQPGATPSAPAAQPTEPPVSRFRRGVPTPPPEAGRPEPTPPGTTSQDEDD